MKEKNIPLERVRHREYTVKYENSSGEVERYKWNSYVKNSNKPRITYVTEDCYYWLLSETDCFRDGDLKLVENDETQDYIDEVKSIPEYKANTHSKEEIIELLTKATDKKLKDELSKVTELMEKNLIIETAKEIKLDSAKKQKIIVETLYGENVEIDSFFGDEE